MLAPTTQPPAEGGTTRPTAVARSRKLWIVVPLLLVGTALALFWLVRITGAVRLEARGRFFEQYNRQQLLLAEQAARSVEQVFETLHRNLDLVVSLFEGREVTGQRGLDVQGSLAKVYESLANTPIMDMAVFDREGTVVTTFPPSPGTVGTNLSWRDYFVWARDAGHRGQMYVTAFRDLVAGKAKGEKAVIVVEGIYGRDSQFQGLALFTLNFDELARRHVLTVRIGEQGYAWLVDAQNETVLVDPRGRVNGRSFAGAFLPKWPKLYELLESSRDGRSGTGWYDFEDPGDSTRAVRKLVGYAPVRVGDHLWVLGVATPEREVEGLLSSFLARQEALSRGLVVAILAGAVLLCAGLVTWNLVLSRQVSARTVDAEQARAELETTFAELIAAKKLAAVGQLALGMAHEIRNPLSAIQLNVEMIREESEAPDHLGESFDIVEEEIRRLNRLLNDIMGFARPRALQLGLVDLGQEARRAVQFMERLLAEEGVEVEVRVGDGVQARCDAEQVRQVLLNLMLNAVEAMRKVSGPKRLGVAAERDRNAVTLRVSDTGVGLPPADRERIFEPFFTSKAQGGGLGLATVQGIVLRHGGAVEVESEAGAGTTFTVRLPVDGPESPREAT